MLINIFRKKRLDKSKRKRVVLYHAMTAYHFLGCLVDKLDRNKEDHGILLISRYLTNVYPHYNELIQKRVFDKILIYDIGEYAKCKSEQEYETKIIEYFHKLLKNAGVVIEDCDEIHIAGAHQGFGSYVCLKNLRFYFYEEGAGIISKSLWFSQFEKNTDYIKYLVTSKHGLFEGINDLIIEARFVYNAQVPGYSNKKGKNFEIVKILKKLGKDDVDMLLNFFKVPVELKLSNKTYIIMGENLTYDGRSLSNEEKILLYQRMMDYYAPNDVDIVFKPHPADRANYEKFLEHAKTLQSYVPSEMLAIVLDRKFEAVMTISSTGVKNMGSFVKEMYFLGYGYLELSTYIYQVDVAFALINHLKPYFKSFFHYGIQNDQISNFLSIAVKDKNLQTRWLNINSMESKSISIIGNVESEHRNVFLTNLKKVDKSSVFIFINSDRGHNFFAPESPELLEYIVPITLRKRKMRDNSLESTDDITIYVFCKDENLQRKIQGFKYYRLLKHTGIYIEVNSIADEELENRRLNLNNYLYQGEL
jgi:hypothetical protein